jgi:hypothetical protein
MEKNAQAVHAERVGKFTNGYTTLFQPGSDHLGELEIDGTK